MSLDFLSLYSISSCNEIGTIAIFLNISAVDTMYYKFLINLFKMRLCMIPFVMLG